MQSNVAAKNEQGILLDAGTNEAEILVFNVGCEQFGVNVAKVREVLTIDEVTALPDSHAAIDGVVRIRNSVVPLVNLARFLDAHRNGSSGEGEGEGDTRPGAMLLLEFNQELIAFRVESVDRIHRVSWKQTVPLPQVAGMTAPVTSVILLAGHLVPLLDFESIGTLVGACDHGPCDLHSTASERADRSALPIVFAEDSHLIGQMLHRALSDAGYVDIRGFSDGQALWDYLSELAEETPREHLSHRVAAVISDVEMPRLDGFSLTRRIREHAALAELPVILFSSLVSASNEKKGRQVGATAQVPKPRYDELVTALVEHIRTDQLAPVAC